MATEAGVFSSASWQASGGGTLVTVNKGLLTFPDVQSNPETLLLATGINQRLRAGHDLTVIVQDISAFAALKALMQSNTELEFNINGARTHTWDPVRFTVKYVLDQVPNAAEVFIGADGAAGDPTSQAVNWTSLGSIEGGNPPTITINVKEDGVGKGLYVTTSVDWTIRLVDDAATGVQTTLASFQQVNARLAVLSPDGTYMILGGANAGEGVFAQWEPVPKFGVDEFSSGVDLQVSGVAGDVDDLIVLTSTPPDYVHAFELAMQAKSSAVSDFYSVA